MIVPLRRDYFVLMAFICKSAEVSKQFSLGKTERLKSRKQIGLLFSSGKNFSLAPFRVYYSFRKNENTVAEQSRKKNSTGLVQFAVSVPAKNFRKAVERNRLKRLTREAYRLEKLPLQESLQQKNLCLNIFFVYTGKELTDFGSIKKKLQLILNRILKLADEKNSSNS